MNTFYSPSDIPYTVLDFPEPSPSWHSSPEALEAQTIELYRPPPPPPASQQSVPLVEADEQFVAAESSIIHNHPSTSNQPIFHPAPVRVVNAQSLEIAPSSPEMIYTTSNYASQQQYAQQQQYLFSTQDPAYYYEYQCPPPVTTQEYYGEYTPVSAPTTYEYYALAAPQQTAAQTFDGAHPPYQTLQNVQALPQPYYQYQRQIPQISSIPSYVHNYNNAMVPISRHGSYGSIYTPQPSNPSSGATTPNFGYDHPSHISTYGDHDNSETVVSPVTPHDQPISTIPPLLLAQSTTTPHFGQIQSNISTGMTTPTPSHPYADSYEHYGSHDTSTSGYLPLSPVSPALPFSETTCVAPGNTNSLPEPDAIEPSSQNGNEVPPESSESITSSPRETAVAAASGTTNAISTSSNALAMTQAEERLKKLRERRHVVACTFCRGRKIACQATSAGTKGATKSSEESKLGPKLGAKRGGSLSSSSRPPCDNCLRRGRECVYPERAPRHPRRRRRMPSPVQTPSPEVIMPSASSGSSAAPSPIDYSSCATSPVLSKTR